MAFDSFRDNGFATYYGEIRTPWLADILTSGIIFAFAILACSLYITLLGYKGWEKLFLFTRITVSLFIGAVILVTIFTQSWETAQTSTRTKYKAGTGVDVNVTVGVYIGLKGVNITLRGDKDQIAGETIDYNEHFSWDGPQGRLGFGPYAGRFNQEYRAAYFRGLPLPILWVAEYFTLDGEGIRWGRYYRQAGFCVFIMLWLAFPLWILSNILFFVLLRFGAYLLALTGFSMLTATIIWATHRNFTELRIPFTAHDILDFSFGPSFWLVLVTGLVCILLGLAVFLMDKFYPTEIAKFFSVDVLQDCESLVEEDDELERSTDIADGSNGVTTEDEEESSDDDAELYVIPEPAQMGPTSPTYSPGVSSHASLDSAKAYTRTKTLSSSRGRSFRSGENRLTARLQRPRRKGWSKLADHSPGLPARLSAVVTALTERAERTNRNRNTRDLNNDIELTNFEGQV